jgi:hypothetical protein
MQQIPPEGLAAYGRRLCKTLWRPEENRSLDS